MRKVLAGLVLVGMSALTASAQSATNIATGAEAAFEIVAPIVITIATFFVVVRIAKRVVK